MLGEPGAAGCRHGGPRGQGAGVSLLLAGFPGCFHSSHFPTFHEETTENKTTIPIHIFAVSMSDNASQNKLFSRLKDKVRGLGTQWHRLPSPRQPETCVTTREIQAGSLRSHGNLLSHLGQGDLLWTEPPGTVGHSWVGERFPTRRFPAPPAGHKG